MILLNIFLVKMQKILAGICNTQFVKQFFLFLSSFETFYDQSIFLTWQPCQNVIVKFDVAKIAVKILQDYLLILSTKYFYCENFLTFKPHLTMSFNLIILRPYSHETFWHTIMRYCDKKILR